MMKQYFEIKEKAADCIMFFRLGDFYEMFFEDAEIAAKELELVLTGRDCGLEKRAPMCGVPFHAANNYISKLVSRGYKVAICEQVEDPAAAKGIVKRDIIKIITPGTYTDSSFLEEGKNNYIMSIFINEKTDFCGMCFTDVSTGEFYCTDTKANVAVILDEMSKFNPIEMIHQDNIDGSLLSSIKEKYNILFSIFPKIYFVEDEDNILENQFNNFKDLTYSNELLNCIIGITKYLHETQKTSLSHINTLEYYNIIDYLTIDANSRRNLELTETIRDCKKRGSLLWVMDKTNTAMGARRLRKWIEQPLVSKESIEKRLCAVEELLQNMSLHDELKEMLRDIYDIERLIGKISSKSVNPKELFSLKNSIGKIPGVKKLLNNFNNELMGDMFNNLDNLEEVYSILDNSLAQNAPITIKEGNIIKSGYNSEIDSLREAKAHGKEWIASLEQSERAAVNIKSLKVGYNKVFGYYIEITKANLHLVPEGRYIRKQTLSNSERFITPELKEMEEKILGAEEKLVQLEYEAFVSIRDSVEKEINRMKKSAKIISEIDCLSSLTTIALENNYNKPKINTKGIINIKEGRHPVVEKMLEGNSFVENNTYMNTNSEQLLLITGPNMAGKSTYMRQVALIVLMAQIGSFVPAKEADISICDKIFTRIGASDDLASGKSTFMVEMWEVSNILKNATNRSLVLLDEVGRGTSTYDGLSIAWSVIEYLCRTSSLRCKTLFATHYHELIKLEGEIEGVKNYSVAVKEIDNEIVFLRKIVPGGTDESYGIEVAKLAGIPQEVIDRAKEILYDLEKVNCNLDDECNVNEDNKTYNIKDVNKQIEIEDKENTFISQQEAAVSANIFVEEDVKQLDILDISRDNLISEIKNIDILKMNPMEGFNKLYELINKAKNI
jgi:DNA mismatch repair protein MutS